MNEFDALDPEFSDLEDNWEDRQRRISEIDSEFVDETENWYHKWNEGLLGDDYENE